MRLGKFNAIGSPISGTSSSAWLAAAEDGSRALLKKTGERVPSTEFRLLAELEHPGLPRIIDCGVDDNQFWIATPWLEGGVLEDGLPAWADEVAIAAATLHTLEYLRSCGVVHGDVHPGNLLAAREGFPARLLDFGLASDGEAPPAGRLGFIAPEVRRGEPRSCASDLYGLGISLRERGAARSSRVASLVEDLTSSDPQVRVGAAREFSAVFPRPSCGPRRNCREADTSWVLRGFQDAKAGAKGILFVGGPGMGKTELIRRLALECRARGWTVEREARGDARNLALRWSEFGAPLVIAIDDLDRSGWAETVAGGIRLASDKAMSRVLVVATSRGPMPSWPGESRKLEGLGVAEIGGIFRQVSGVETLSGEDLKRVAEVAGGAPGTAVSVARSAVAAGAVEYRLGAWTLRPHAPIPVPADAAEAARPLVDALERGAVRALAAAALGAGGFSREAVMEASGATAADLAALDASGLWKSDECGIAPVDAAVGDAAIGRQAPEERAALHGLLAGLSERAGAPRWVSAWHWVRSGNAEVAIDASIEAAAALEDTGDTPGARAILAAAGRLVGGRPTDPLRIEAEILLIDARIRADEGLARRAEALSRADIGERVRARLAAMALALWARMGRLEEMEAAVGRLDPVFQGWGRDRVLMAHAISRAARGEPPGPSGLLELDRCKFASEARIIGFHRSVSGDFRGAARAEVRAMRLAQKAKSWKDFGAAANGAVSNLTLIGRKWLAWGVLERGLAIAVQAGRSGTIPGLALARAGFATADGQVGRGLAALVDYDRISVLSGEPSSARAAVRPMLAYLHRFAGRPAHTLAILEREAGVVPATIPWHETARVLALLDLAKWNAAAESSAKGMQGFRQRGDASGVALHQALHVLALRGEGAGSGWIAAADALPDRVDGDVTAAGLCAFVKALGLLARGKAEEAEAEAPRLISLARSQRLAGGELAARLAALLAASGKKAVAAELIRSLGAIPDSPLIELWTAVARAGLEVHGLVAMRHLEAVKAKLEEAGFDAKRAWLEAAARAGMECGRVDEAVDWDRRVRGHEGEKASEEEDSVTPRSLASQARYIRDIVRDINAERSVAPLLDKVLDSAIAISGAERGCLVLVDGNKFTVRAARPGNSGLGSEDVFSRTISDKVLVSGEAFHSSDAMLDSRLGSSASIPRLKVHSVACVPFRIRGTILGSLYLDHRKNADAFDPNAIDALQTLADLAAVAIENAQLFEDLERQREALAEKATRLERRLEEADILGQGDADAGLKYRYGSIVGRGTAMMTMLRSLDRATDRALPVLIQGETGSGKELVARALHANGPFRKGPFVAENCAAISPMLIESELFGHVRGAFSGASTEHAGLFRSADGGVLFLDEIGELEAGTQAKLLRVLEDGVVRPVGSDKTYRVKLRVVAATHRDLESLVAAGKFRGDLYYRLSSLRVMVPALRDRREDIPLLVSRILEKSGRNEVEAGAMKLLISAKWPGNVRQLQHVLGMVSGNEDGRITVEAVKAALGQDVSTGEDAEERLSDALEKVRASRVQAAILSCDGSLERAARKLGLTYQGIRKIAAKHKLLKLKELCRRLNFSVTRPGRRATRRKP